MQRCGLGRDAPTFFSPITFYVLFILRVFNSINKEKEVRGKK